MNCCGIGTPYCCAVTKAPLPIVHPRYKPIPRLTAPITAAKLISEVITNYSMYSYY